MNTRKSKRSAGRLPFSRMATVLVASLVATGCSTQGPYLQEEEALAIKESIRTAQELHEALGSPSVTIPRDDGKTMWVYEGIYTQADATSYIPYLGLLVGTNSKYCTKLTVLVDRETGELSDWNYVTAEDTDFWANTDDKCTPRQSE